MRDHNLGHVVDIANVVTHGCDPIANMTCVFAYTAVKCGLIIPMNVIAPRTLKLQQFVRPCSPNCRPLCNRPTPLTKLGEYNYSAQYFAFRPVV